MNVLKLIFLPYLGLGLFEGVVMFPPRAGRTLHGPKEMAILFAAHLLLFVLAVLLVKNSATRDGGFRFGLSPSGLFAGLILTYLTGWGIAVFAR